MRRMGFSAAVLLVLGAAGAQPDARKPPDPALYDALRDVINHGAVLFNDHGDYAACYRVYQGALLAIRPQLSGHPDLIRDIEEALKKAESQPRILDRAFTLRTALDTVRGRFKPTLPMPNPESEPEAGKLSGTVTLDGKPGPTGYLTLHAPDQRIFSTFIHDDGKFSFRTPLPIGSYQVTITTAGKEGSPPPRGQYPEKYGTATQSGLRVEIKKGPQNVAFDLK